MFIMPTGESHAFFYLFYVHPRFHVSDYTFASHKVILDKNITLVQKYFIFDLIVSRLEVCKLHASVDAFIIYFFNVL